MLSKGSLYREQKWKKNCLLPNRGRGSPVQSISGFSLREKTFIALENALKHEKVIEKKPIMTPLSLPPLPDGICTDPIRIWTFRCQFSNETDPNARFHRMGRYDQLRCKNVTMSLVVTTGTTNVAVTG